MTPIHLARLIALARAATPGRWYACDAAGHPNNRWFVRSDEKGLKYSTDHAVCEAWGGEGPRPKDASFIAAANPATVQALAEALQGALGALYYYREIYPEHKGKEVYTRRAKEALALIAEKGIRL
jgi:hypothetical protein